LAEISEIPAEDIAESTAETLRDVHEMRALIYCDQRRSQFSTRRQIMDEDEALVQKLNQPKTLRRNKHGFSPPPFPSYRTENIEIVPITSPRTLHILGQEQHNCVAAYAIRIIEGSTYIYRVIVAGEKCTLSLQKNNDNAWQLSQLEAAFNRPASQRTQQAVQAWLAVASTTKNTLGA
jgi:hypothetical protein